MAPERLKLLVPAWAHPWLDTLLEPWVLATLSAFSIGVFTLSLVGLPWFARHIPSDYLLSEGAPRPRAHGLALLARFGRNVLGAMLLLLGVLMLALPGQGVVTLLIALSLLDFPGKHALQRRIVGQRHVLATLNRIRTRSGHPPLRTS